MKWHEFHLQNLITQDNQPYITLIEEGKLTIILNQGKQKDHRNKNCRKE